MKKFSWIFLIFAFIFQPVFAENSTEALSKLLGNYKSYQADFSQVNYGKNNKVAQKSQGVIYMLRPGRFRWETKRPYQQILVANGDSLWVYDVDLKQASRQSISKRGFNPGELLTSSVPDLAQKYTITQEAGNWFKLVPKQSSRGFRLAYLHFQDGKLTGLKVLNQLNQVNVFTFSDVHLNPNLSPGLFQFKPPAGVQVLKG